MGYKHFGIYQRQATLFLFRHVHVHVSYMVSQNSCIKFLSLIKQECMKVIPDQWAENAHLQQLKGPNFMSEIHEYKHMLT
jgi:hypothetical protein